MAIKIRKPRKNELILLSICLIIIGAALINGLIFRIYLNFSRIEKEIALGEEKLLRLQAILRQKQQLDDEYNKTVSSHQGYADLNSLLREIENIASELELNIVSLKPAQLSDDKFYQAYSIKMEFQDAPVTVIKFCHLLTEQLDNIGIQRVQIKAGEKQEALRTSLLLNAAVFKDARVN